MVDAGRYVLRGGRSRRHLGAEAGEHSLHVRTKGRRGNNDHAADEGDHERVLGRRGAGLVHLDLTKSLHHGIIPLFAGRARRCFPTLNSIEELRSPTLGSGITRRA